MPEKRIIRISETLKKTGLSRSALYDLRRRDSFPKPVLLGARSIGFLADEVESWIDARVSDRDFAA